MATIRRASHQLPGIDPRSPMTLSIPQHQILTSLHTFPSPINYSPSPFTTKAPHPTPTTAYPPITPLNQTTPAASSPIHKTAQLFYTPPPNTPSSAVPKTPTRNKDRSTSLKFLLQTGRVPTVQTQCPCSKFGERKHQLNECPELAALKAAKLSLGFEQGSPTPSPRGSWQGQKSPRSPGERKAVHAARKWRMKTLLGRYKMAVQRQEESVGSFSPSFSPGSGFGATALRERRMSLGSGLGKGRVVETAGSDVPMPLFKSPRPDVVELGLVTEGLGKKVGRLFG